MNAASWVLLILIGIGLIAALRHLHKHGAGCCGGCNRDCAHCTHSCHHNKE